PLETPTHTSCPQCSYFTMATLPQIRRDVTAYFGAKTQLWLTEYGYQTNPPDTLLGVSQLKQATYLGSAALRVWKQPGVTVLIQFLVRDEPSLGGWQSGLYTSTGKPKLSVHAFALPLAEASRSGSRVSLWGMVRPGSGARSYVVQAKRGSAWRTLASGRTGSSGAFARTVTVAVGAQIRLSSPALGYAGPALTVS
ncbi:MAG: hypothetical protein ABUS54_13700, partial [Actinomycetota bacterium]